MPWLVGTALIVLWRERGAVKSWTVLLAITAFPSVCWVPLVRSGVLTSVHSLPPTPGAASSFWLFGVIGGSLLLFAWRAGSGWA